jgi:phosphate transport system substrate-binding protein
MVAAVLLLGVALCLTSCGTPPSSETPVAPAEPAEPVKAIRVSGAWALYPLMLRWAEEYQKLHPEIHVGVWSGGTDKGVRNALEGVVDIGMVSWPVETGEDVHSMFWVPVARDAVIVVANAGNPVAAELADRGLKENHLAALWLGEAAVTWGSLVSKPAITSEVRAYTRSDFCGTAEAWAQCLGRHQEDLKGTRVLGEPAMVAAVQGNRLGIGFGNLSSVYNIDTGLPAAGLLPVPLDADGDGRITDAESFYGTHDAMKRAIAEGVYPCPPARDLSLVMKGEPEGLPREFLLWILTDGQEYVSEGGCVALPQERLNSAVEKLG